MKIKEYLHGQMYKETFDAIESRGKFGRRFESCIAFCLKKQYNFLFYAKF